ncbi:BTAD domain-containing putative transcriptional regulator [Kitasatospora sp. NPDC093679]|uniref:AfsR/SARP family transcriptional regulator n=1 Tax=Kitasatospora sp. NPDC093679 TaxID=3154983 RepID=UPI0034169CCA
MGLQPHDADDDVHFALLGPFEVTRGATSVPLQARRSRLLLAALACRPREIVSVEHLSEVVWAEDPPTTVRTQIQICISTLRKTLGVIGMSEALVTHPVGYALMLAPGRRDVDRFTELVRGARSASDAGDLETSVRTYREALALWRGPALGGVDSDVLQRRAVALDEERLTVLEEYFDLELLRGRDRGLIQELADRIAEHPLREKLRGQLMLALHRAGRRSDALQIYREGRRLLVRELGIEPSDELRRLEQEILRDAPELNPGYGKPEGPAAPRQLPRRSRYFIGREETVHRLTAVLADPRGPEDHPYRAVNLYGPGGTGKTALAVHVAHALQDRFGDGQLYYDLHGSNTVTAAPVRVLDHFLRALGVPPGDIPDELDERAAMFRSLVAEKKILVILDDAAEEHQISPLLPGGRDCGVVVTSRRPQTGLPELESVHLDVLTQTEAVELLGRIVGDRRVAQEPLASAQLVREIDRLPLALGIVGARLAASPHRTISSMAHRIHDERRRLDELAHGNRAVRSTISSTFDTLKPDLRDLLCDLSLFGAEALPGWMAGAILGGDTEDANDVIDEAATSQLLVATDAEPTDNPRYRFHSLVRLYLRESVDRLPAEQRARTVRAVLAGWLGLMDLAQAQLWGGNYTVVRGGSARWQAPEAVVRHVLTDPLGWLDTERPGLLAAVGLAAEHGLDEECWEAATQLVTLFEVRQHYADWQESHETALQLVRRTGNVRGEAAVRCSLGSLYLSQRQAGQALPHLERSLALFEELDETGGTALANRNIALCLHTVGDLDGALRRYERAAELFRLAGDPLGRAHVLSNMAPIHAAGGDPGRAEQELTEALRICQSIGSSRVASMSLHRLGQLCLSQGRLGDALRWYREALAIVRRQADSLGECIVQHGLGDTHMARGDHAEAAGCLEGALVTAEAAGHLHAAAQVRVSLAEVCLAQGLDGRARNLLQEALRVLEDHDHRAALTRARTALARLDGVNR